MDQRFAIVTICLNDREGLERTMASVFANAIAGMEFIVVDGSSTDGSVELVQANAHRITAWLSEPDEGIYEAQNKGWRMANASHVLFLNAGDVLAGNDVLAQAMQAITPEVDIAYGDAHLANAQGVYDTKVHPKRLTSAWLMRETVAHQAQFIRRDLLERLGGLDVSYRIVADYDLLARAFWQQRARFAKLPFVVCTFDTRGLSSAPDHRDAVRRERRAVQRRHAPRFWYLAYHAYAAFNRWIGR